MKTLAPGVRVRLARPESPRAYRRGQVGTVREVSEYQPKPAKSTETPPPVRWLVWVAFEDGLRSAFWDSELEVVT